MNESIHAGRNLDHVAAAKAAVEAAAGRVQTARRDFLKLFGYGTAGLMLGGLSIGKDGLPSLIPEVQAGPYKKSPYENAFNFDQGLLYMNIGTTGSSPSQVVQDAHLDYKDIAGNPAAYYFGQQVMRNTIAPGFGCDPYELVLSFNTTDGLARIVMGIPFAAGDELITTNMEEGAGISAYTMLQDRFGVVVKTVKVPTNDAYSDAEVLARFQAQLTSKTKAILFSSPVYLTGARLPAKQLCQWAAANGIISIVDGAHLPGMVALDLHDMGCDFFAGAGHKWQCGPGQTGFLYIRNGFNPNAAVVQRPTTDPGTGGAVAPNAVAIQVPGYTNTGPLPTYYATNTLSYGSAGILLHGVRNPEHNVAAILQIIGNGSRPTQRALVQCCQMWDAWGRQAIEDYIVSLAQYLRSRIVDIWGFDALSIPYEATPATAARTGLTSFNPFSPGFDYNAELTATQSAAQKVASSAALATLKNDYQIVIRNNSVPHALRNNPEQNAAPGTFSTPLRISTHLFHAPADVDRLIDALLLVVPHP